MTKTWKKYLKLEDVVYTILLHEPETRENAEMLYYRVCLKILGADKRNEYFRSAYFLPLYDVITSIKGGVLPTFESVSRCGRKVREKHPSLLTQQQMKRKLKRESDYFKYVKESEDLVNTDLSLEEMTEMLGIIEEK